MTKLDTLCTPNLSRRHTHGICHLSTSTLTIVLSVFIGLYSMPVAECQNTSPPSINYNGFTLSATSVSPGTQIFSFPSVSGSPTPTVNFYKDGQLMDLPSGEINKAAEISDAGYWWIVANNSLGAVISNKIKLSVYYFNNTWNESTVEEPKAVETRDAVVLNMPPIDTYPELTSSFVKWFTGSGATIENNLQSDSTYYISNDFNLIVLNTQSWYNDKPFQVEFHNKFGDQTKARSRIFRLAVSPTSRQKVGPSFVIPLPQTSEVVEGPSGQAQHILECVVNSSPLADATIKWYKISSGSSTRQDMSTSTDTNRRRLTVRNPVTDDRYICEAEMSGQDTITSTTTIKLINKPSFSRRMDPVTQADIGSTRTLNCEITVEGTKTWFKDAQIIRSSEKFVISENGSLTLRNVGLEDSGVYQCMVENKAGTDIDRTYFQLNSAPPTISQRPENVTMVSGPDATLTCGVEGKPTPVLSWIFNPIFAGLTREVGTEPTLTVVRALWTDSGNYLCKANNSLGFTQASATLTVYNRTSIIPQQYPIEEQKSAGVERACRLNKDSRVSASIQWFKTTEQGTLQIQNEPGYRVLDDDNQVLRFISLRSLTDEGQFSCSVTSAAGNASARYNITIIEVPLRPNAEAETAEAPRTITITWTAPFNGNRPILNYRVRRRETSTGADWMIIGDSLAPDATSYDARDLKPAKTYEFVITAVNSVGEGQWSVPTAAIRIDPEVPSAAPVIQSITPITQRSVRVTFTPPPRDDWNSDNLLGYVIDWRPNPPSSPPSGSLTYNTSSTGVLSKDIENLLPYTEFWVRIAAFNEVKGAALTYSELQRVTTQEGVPTSPPVINNVLATSSTACQITFEAPDDRTINGQPKGYNIRAYLKDSQAVAKFVRVDATLQSSQTAVVSSLDKYTEYRLNVSLYTDGGESPGALTDCTTLQDRPETVTGLAIPDLGRTYLSLNVTWNPPTVTNGILLYYRVRIVGPGRPAGQNFNITHDQDKTLHYKVIQNLAPDSTYTVTVSAATVIGLGPSLPITKATRPPPVPPQPPTNLAVTNIGSRSAQIRFNPGDDGQAPVKTWIVNYRVKESSNWTWLVNVSDVGNEKSSVSLSDLLTPYTDYFFQIFAVNIAGPSEASETTGMITTKMAPPEGPPRNVSIRAQNYSTLILNWEPLELSEFNGELSGYRVEYQSEYESSPRNATVTNPLSRFFILGNLTAYASYTVKVISKNSQFESDPGEPVSARTIEYVPSRGPSVVTISSKTDSSIDISWTAVAPRHSNGIIAGYKVFYQQADIYELPKVIKVSSQALGARISGLHGFTKYTIQVLAYSGIGDGAKSQIKEVFTLPAAPSVPQSFSMKNIQATTLMLTWRQPKYPNSPIDELKYNLRYKRSTDSGDGVEVTDLTQTYYPVDSLLPGSLYVFTLNAKNNNGTGDSAIFDYRVTSPTNQNKPGQPQGFFIRSAASREMTLKWTKGAENNLPIMNYTLWYRQDKDIYAESDDFIGGDSEEHIIKGLVPATKYFFKLEAVNSLGRSAASVERTDFTQAERPSSGPPSHEIVPRTATSLNITWSNPPQDQWNGQLTQTRIWYAAYSPESQRGIASFEYTDVNYPSTTVMLENLEKGQLYEIRLGSMNSEGVSEPSNPTVIYVGVAVPVGAPSRILDGTVSDTEITVSWEAVPADQTNGQLLGYKVYYQIVGDSTPFRRKRAVTEPQYDLVGPDSTSHTITNLETFKQYLISVTAYNIAGEGPGSQPPIIIITDQGLPGPVDNLTVTEVTLSLVNVTWDVPLKPNGNITHYIVQFYSADDTKGSSTKQTVSHPLTFDEVKIESKNMTYNFTIQAVTKIGAGDPVSVSFKSGPNTGVPAKPAEAEYSNEESGVMVKWTVDSSNTHPVQGYVIEGLDDAWHFVVRQRDPSAEKVLIPNSQLPEAGYIRFQVSLFNQHGIGEPKEADKVEQFYSTWWFLVIIAMGALLIIITITAVLCCYCFRMRAKMAEEAYEQDVIGVDNGYNTYEMRQSFKRENQRRGSKYRAEPPRPSPGAVLYSDEAPPRYDDSSSVTEKGDLTSDEDDDDDTKGKMSGTDSSDDDIDKAGASSVAPSYNNYQYGGYNHYNQSQPVQQSWQNSFGRSRHPRNMYSYTDSEAESSVAPSTSHYRPSNGLRSHQPHTSSSRQNLVDSPDAARSRAPLPNFSSFV